MALVGLQPRRPFGCLGLPGFLDSWLVLDSRRGNNDRSRPRLWRRAGLAGTANVQRGQELTSIRTGKVRDFRGKRAEIRRSAARPAVDEKPRDGWRRIGGHEPV